MTKSVWGFVSSFQCWNDLLGEQLQCLWCVLPFYIEYDVLKADFLQDLAVGYYVLCVASFAGVGATDHHI